MLERNEFTDTMINVYKAYWEFLGEMRGTTRHEGKICRLAGDIDYIYLVELDENDYKHDIENIIEKIKNKEMQKEFVLIPEMYHSDIAGEIIKNYPFMPGYGLGMTKELTLTSYIKSDDKDINIFRINDVDRLKFCGSILNTCFEYRTFSYSHYLDAFNHDGVKFYCAEYRGLPVSACMSLYGSNFVKIVWLGTLNGYRKMGIAQKVMQMAENDALKAGKKLSALTCQKNIADHYEKLNYRQSCNLVFLDYNQKIE